MFEIGRTEFLQKSICLAQKLRGPTWRFYLYIFIIVILEEDKCIKV